MLLGSHYLDLTSDVSELLDPLARVHNAINVKLKGSGNQVFKAAQKLYTASGCWYLLKRYADDGITTHRRETWVWFSERLFKIATGEDAHMDKACRKWERQQDAMTRAGITAAEINEAPRRIVIRKR